MLYIKSLEVENVRCFGRKQKLDFSDMNGNISQWTVILGDNGTGKTSILRSIVSLLPSPSTFLEAKLRDVARHELSIDESKDYRWDLRHKDGEKVSRISLDVVESDLPFGVEPKFEERLEYSIDHNRKGDRSMPENTLFDTSRLSAVYCFGYGANRRMAVESFSGDGISGASETLFRDDAFLQNSSEFFLRLDYDTAKSRKGSNELRRVKELLIQILPKGVKDIQVVKKARLKREVQVNTDFGWIRLDELSLGYKTTIAWLIDFATKMIYYYDRSKTPFQEPAILVLDEIDLHMHPAWQREILENLGSIFTKTQFIVTAHSPLIAQAALASNIVLLTRSRGKVHVENNPDVIKSWRIDQVLTSDLFGLKESRPKEIEMKISRRRFLLKKESLTSAEQIELDRLNEVVHDMPVGETKSEIDAMNILRDFAKQLEIAAKR